MLNAFLIRPPASNNDHHAHTSGTAKSPLSSLNEGQSETPLQEEGTQLQ